MKLAVLHGLNISNEELNKIEKQLPEIEKVRHRDFPITVTISGENIPSTTDGKVNAQKLFQEHIQPMMHNLVEYSFHIFFTPSTKSKMDKHTRRLLEAYIYLHHAHDL